MAARRAGTLASSTTSASSLASTVRPCAGERLALRPRNGATASQPSTCRRRRRRPRSPPFCRPLPGREHTSKLAADFLTAPLPRGARVAIVSRGFQGRRRQPGAGLVPPGQYVVDDFPVLSAGPTPHTPLEHWDFTIVDETGAVAARWTWDEFRALPAEAPTVDIHCVTKWSKLGTRWEGVSVDALLDGVETSADFVIAFSDGGYTTNLPLADVQDGQAWVVYSFGGEDLEPEHGGPARLLVPHLYFWKSDRSEEHTSELQSLRHLVC